MEDFSSQNCQMEFSALRTKTQKQLKKASYLEKEDVAIDIFNDISLRASKNDPIAQDYLAYIFKKGLADVVPVNYEKFMQWQILAGSNGNQYAIDKLNIFLTHALSEVMMVEDFEFIVKRNNLTEENFPYVVGRLFCEAIADELRLNPESLAKEQIMHLEFNAKIMRTFDRARNFVIPKILKFLRN